MITPQKPENENARIEHLRSLNILDTLPVPVLDNITQLAANICQCQISLITLVDEERQWFKSIYQLNTSETSRDVSFCGHAINNPNKLFQIEDAQLDERFHDNPLVTGDPNIRFYAGIPLVSSDQFALGTLCVIDPNPKKLTKEQEQQLRLLSDQVMQIIEYERKKRAYNRLENQKEKSEKELKLIVDNIRDIIYEVDENGNLLFVNQSLIDLTGFTKKELSGFTFWDLVKDEDKAALKDFYLPYIRAGKSQRIPAYRFHLKTKSGSHINVKQTVQFEAKKGRIHRAYGLATDETELVEITKKEREAYLKYELLSDQSQDMICLHDPNGSFRYVSKASKQILGWEPSELQGKSIYDFIHLDDHDRLKKDYHPSLREGKNAGKIDYRLKKKNDEFIWVQSNSSPILKEGQVVQIQSITRDISEERKYQKELEEARLEARKSAQFKEDFLSAMSHEIRTPLNAIIGITQLLINEKTDTTQDENLKLLKFSGDTLLSLINDILDVNKLEADKVRLEVIDFDFEDFLQSLRMSHNIQAEKRQNKLLFLIDDKIPRVLKADRTRLSQVINNLLSNAIKFTYEGDIKVQIKLLEQRTSSSLIRFEISDTGIGIPENKLRTIFNPFEQASSSDNRVYGGTGLGLYIVNNLLQLMGSEVSVQSQENVGTSFSFQMDLLHGDQNFVHIDTENEISKSTFKDTPSILLVEDNEINQWVIRKILEKWNVKCDVASNGKEALTKIKSKKHSLVLMDIEMPILNGIQTTRSIREDLKLSHEELPIVALSANAGSDVVQNVLEAGMTDYVSKPVIASELHKSLSMYLEISSPNETLTFEQHQFDTNSFEKSLAYYTNGEPELNIQFTRIMLDSMEEFLTKFSQSVEERDSHLLRDIRHKMTTNFRVLGLNFLEKYIKDVQFRMEQGLDISKNRTNVIKELESIQESLQEFFESLTRK